MSGQLTGYGLSLPSWAALGIIFDAGQLRLSDIVEALGVKPPVATRLVQELEDLGLVSRTSDSTDRRAAIISPTAAGRATVATVEQQLRDDLRAFLGDVSRAELAVYLKVLKKIAAKL